jgi:glycosyltransferase involved in cell wall biosynthesis
MPDACATPRVSIGVPVYNGADFLEQALASILGQTFSDFELIVCDNASTDRTEAICRKYQASDRRVRYVRQARNLGAAATYNRTFFEARGEYFKWAAHDDVLAPDFLEKCVKALDADPGLFLAHGATVLIDESGNAGSCYLDCLASDSDDPVVRFRTWMERPRGQCNPAFGVLRREWMGATGLHGDYVGADRVLLGEYALRCRARTLWDTYLYRRIHPGISTVANPGNLRLAQWFSGREERGLKFKRYRQLREFARMIHRVPLSRAQRFGAWRVLLRWVFDLRSEYLKELLLPLYINGQDTPLKSWLRRHTAARKGPSTA